MNVYYGQFKRWPNDADALHSALLHRLLSGKPLLDKPPPKRYSYPCYDLAEGKAVEVAEINLVVVSPDQHEAWYKDRKGYTVCIDQHVGWKWIEKNGKENDKGVPEAGILEYEDGSRYRMWWGTTTRKRLDKTHPDGFITYEVRVPFLQRIKEDDNGGKDRDIQSLGQSDAQ